MTGGPARHSSRPAGSSVQQARAHTDSPWARGCRTAKPRPEAGSAGPGRPALASMGAGLGVMEATQPQQCPARAREEARRPRQAAKRESRKSPRRQAAREASEGSGGRVQRARAHTDSPWARGRSTASDRESHPQAEGAGRGDGRRQRQPACPAAGWREAGGRQQRAAGGGTARDGQDRVGRPSEATSRGCQGGSGAACDAPGHTRTLRGPEGIALRQPREPPQGGGCRPTHGRGGASHGASRRSVGRAGNKAGCVW